MAAGALKLTHLVENLVEEEALAGLGRLTRADMKNVPLMGTGYKRVYICSPYAGEVERNVALCRQYCRYAIEKKKCQPVASHLMYPSLLDDSDPLQREMALAFGIALLRNCSEVWVFRGEDGVSKGMQREIDAALRWKIPVHFINDPKAFGLPGWNPIREYDKKHASKQSPSKQHPSDGNPGGKTRKEA